MSLSAQQQSGAPALSRSPERSEGSVEGWHYPLADGPGSLRQWTDVGDQVTYAARYAPFGSLLWQQGTAPAPWGFAAEMQDPTGLLYLRARWYDPALGRFLTRDPLPGLPSVPASLNPYVYALNNPVLYTDPSGEFIVPLLVAAAIGGGLAAYSYFQAQPCATFPSALSDPAFQRAVGIGMLAGAVGGLIGFGVGAIGVGAFGGGLAGAVISGAVGGGLAGGVGEALRQVATYGHVHNPQLLGAAMLSGAVTGGVFGAVGYGLRSLQAPAQVSTGTTRPVQPHEVGTVDDLLTRSVPGDRLQVHHVPQAHPAGQVIPGYDPNTAPGIVLPDYEHQAIPNLTGAYGGTARDLVARDLWNLRMHTGAPNSALQQLLNLIHQMYGF